VVTSGECESTASATGVLCVMYSIYLKLVLRSSEGNYLPKPFFGQFRGGGEFLGCLVLTEPDSWIQPKADGDNFKDMGDHYLLNGAKKMWISTLLWLISL